MKRCPTSYVSNIIICSCIEEFFYDLDGSFATCNMKWRCSLLVEDIYVDSLLKKETNGTYIARCTVFEELYLIWRKIGYRINCQSSPWFVQFEVYVQFVTAIKLQLLLVMRQTSKTRWQMRTTHIHSCFQFIFSFKTNTLLFNANRCIFRTKFIQCNPFISSLILFQLLLLLIRHLKTSLVDPNVIFVQLPFLHPLITHYVFDVSFTFITIKLWIVPNLIWNITISPYKFRIIFKYKFFSSKSVYTPLLLDRERRIYTILLGSEYTDHSYWES